MTPRVIVMMGVSGSGKTTVGEALAARLGCPFEEGDSLHPAANIAKMAAGVPLDDADRAPWLAAVAAWIARRDGGWGVVSCSALKRAYRDTLRRQGSPATAFVLLDPPRTVLEARVTHRHHFMPASLLGSQLETLERPGPDERALTVRGDVGEDCDAILAWLGGMET